jgi:hypothetical protein
MNICKIGYPMGEVIKLKMRPESNMSVSRVKKLIEETKFKSMLVVGYDADGYMTSINSSMNNAQVLWLLKGAEKMLFKEPLC